MTAIEDVVDLRHKLETRDRLIKKMTAELNDLKSLLRNNEGQTNLDLVDKILSL